MEVQFEVGSSIELFPWVLHSGSFTDVRGIWTQLVFVETSVEESWVQCFPAVPLKPGI